MSAALNSIDGTQRRKVYQVLMQGFAGSAGQQPEARWAWLTAAHVVGQHAFGLHWHSHTAMLRYALATRDSREAAGQLFRLLLVPLGHLLGRLPVGNIGRATVSAFQPMPLDPVTAQLIGQAFAAVTHPGNPREISC